jgi:hypothetical protein
MEPGNICSSASATGPYPKPNESIQSNVRPSLRMSPFLRVCFTPFVREHNIFHELQIQRQYQNERASIMVCIFAVSCLLLTLSTHFTFVYCAFCVARCLGRNVLCGTNLVLFLEKEILEKNLMCSDSGSLAEAKDSSVCIVLTTDRTTWVRSSVEVTSNLLRPTQRPIQWVPGALSRE